MMRAIAVLSDIHGNARRARGGPQGDPRGAARRVLVAGDLS